jgi:sulfur-carrier protein
MLVANRARDDTGRRPPGVDAPPVVLLLFAEARVAAGTGRQVLPGRTVGEVLDLARARYGARFTAVLDGCRVWVNGDPARPDLALHAGDEVAVLPPVSGGAV